MSTTSIPKTKEVIARARPRKRGDRRWIVVWSLAFFRVVSKMEYPTVIIVDGGETTGDLWTLNDTERHLAMKNKFLEVCFEEDVQQIAHSATTESGDFEGRADRALSTVGCDKVVCFDC